MNKAGAYAKNDHKDQVTIEINRTGNGANATNTKDMRIITQRVPRLDPSGFRPGAPEEERKFPQPSGTSAVLIDATRKWDYAPVGLPDKKHMERAIQIWEEEKLPALTLKPLWHGYHLGRWTKQDEEEAQLMVNGEFEKYGKKKKEGRIKQT